MEIYDYITCVRAGRGQQKLEPESSGGRVV